MCRLFGYATRGPKPPVDVLDKSFKSFAALSTTNSDGWGMAWFGDNDTLCLAKTPEPAHASREFSCLADTARASTLIMHVRDATPGLPVCKENTHPFIYRDMAFAHNGSIKPVAAIEEMVSPSLRSQVHGTTDSEWYFMAIVSRMVESSLVEAIRTVLQDIRHSCHSTSLNFLFLTPTALYAACTFDPQAPRLREDSDYYRLHYSVMPDAVLVGSVGWDMPGRCQDVENGKILVVDRKTLQAAIVDVTTATAVSS